MVIDPNRQLMQASVVASQGIHRISECPPSCDLGYKTKKLVGYSHNSTKPTRSSKIPSGLIVDMSANSRMVGVGLRFVNPHFCIVYIVITLMATPRYNSTFGIYVFPIFTMTLGFPRSSYLARRFFPIINLDSFPMTWTVGGSPGFIPSFLT